MRSSADVGIAHLRVSLGMMFMKRYVPSVAFV